MIPVFFHLGPLPVYSFGFMVAFGVALSLFLLDRLSRKTGFPGGELAGDLVFAAVVAGFLGARAAYIFEKRAWYGQAPLKIFALWEGGLIFYGGVAGALAGLLIFSKIKKISFAKVLDFLLPYVALTHAFGRIGCFLNGCCAGKACDLPWAVKFPGTEEAVHPTQLYEAVLNFLLFLFLRSQYSRKRFDGQTALLYFMLYGALRFFIEFFREGNPFWGVLTVNQWTSLVIVGVAGVFYARSRKSGI